MKQILVAGIGNVLMGDDGVGPAVIESLAGKPGVSLDADVEDLGTPGLELAGYLACRRTLIIVDAVQSNAPAGTIFTFNKAQILDRCAPARAGSHAPALAASLESLEFAGLAPQFVTLVAIAGACFEFGAGLTAPVRAALAPAADLISGVISSYREL